MSTSTSEPHVVLVITEKTTLFDDMVLADLRRLASNEKGDLMSTGFELFKQTQTWKDPDDTVVELDLTEHSTIFDLDMWALNPKTEDWPPDTRPLTLYNLTADQVVDIAMKLLQPTLYNVSNPREFMETVIKKKLDQLFV